MNVHTFCLKYLFGFIVVFPQVSSAKMSQSLLCSTLLTLFSMFCFKCKTENPKVNMTQNGTMVTVRQYCKSCGESFTWRSQPFVFGRYPAGNVLLSFAILMAGASISKHTHRGPISIIRVSSSFLPSFCIGNLICHS